MRLIIKLFTIIILINLFSCSSQKRVNKISTKEIYNFYFEHVLKTNRKPLPIKIYYKSLKDWNSIKSFDTIRKKLRVDALSIKYLKERTQFPNELLIPLDSIINDKNELEYLLNQNKTFIKLNQNKINSKNIKIMHSKKGVNYMRPKTWVYSISKPLFTKNKKYCFVTNSFDNGSLNLFIFKKINFDKWEMIGVYLL